MGAGDKMDMSSCTAYRQVPSTQTPHEVTISFKCMIIFNCFSTNYDSPYFYIVTNSEYKKLIA